MIKTKAQFEEMGREIAEALSAVAQRYDCNIAIEGIKYDDMNTHITINFKSKSNENGEEYEVAEFKKYCDKFGFTIQDYGKKIKLTNCCGTFIGFFPNGRKYTCRVRGEDGKFYKATADCIRAQID